MNYTLPTPNLEKENPLRPTHRSSPIQVRKASNRSNLSMWDTKYKQYGKAIIIATGMVLQQKDQETWTVKYDDGYQCDYNEKALKDILVINDDDKMIFKQLDYILVSNRWM